MSGADGQTAHKTCGDATSAVLGQGVHATAQKTVEIPQSQFSVQVYMLVVAASGADGQTAQKTVEIPQAQFSTS